MAQTAEKPFIERIAAIIDPNAMDDRFPQAAISPSPREQAIEKARAIFALIRGEMRKHGRQDA